jgi:hypothetical protein
MRKLFLIGVGFLAGCGGNILGPFAYRPPEKVDDPLLSIPEQQARGRDRFSYPEETQDKLGNIAPRTWADRPSPTGW